MTVRRRLLASFGVLLLFMAVPATFAVLGLTDLRNLAVEGRGRHATASLALGRLDAALVRYDLYVRSLLVSPSEATRREVRAALFELRSEVEALEQARYGDVAGALSSVMGALSTSTDQIEDLVADARLGPATTAFVRIQPLIEEAHRRVTDASFSVDRQAEADFVLAESISSSARTGTLAALLLSFLGAGLVAFGTTATLTGPIRNLVEATGRVGELEAFVEPDLPYDRGDEIGDLSRSFRDMTRRLDELNRMKAEFVTVASHELKTPINVIKAYSELIEEELSADVTEHQAEILHGIAGQSEALARLVNRLMDISRLEAGTYELRREVVHLQDLLTGVVRLFELPAAQHDVELVVRVDDAAPERLVVDLDIMRDEVLGNLVSNAIKFTPPGGRVSIAAWGSPGGAVIEVADTGPGIPAGHRGHVFEKYYQIERSRSMGSGLGLAIAREMVEAHGGSIGLVGADDEETGAVFHVRIPVGSVEPVGSPAAEECPA